MNRYFGIAAGLIKAAHHVPAGLADIVDHITFGSFTKDQRLGNEEPRYYYDEATRMSINAVGLANQSLAVFLKEDLPKLTYVHEAGAKIRISLAPLAQGDVFQMVTMLNTNPLVKQLCCELEVNSACPNHRSADGVLRDVITKDPIALESLMQEAQHFSGIKALKIAPCMEYEELEYCVEFAIAYGFEIIVSGNTKRIPAYINNKRVLSQEFGGMGGTPLFEETLIQVDRLGEIIGLLESKTGPRIIACGGIMDDGNALSMLIAGAEQVQVATYYAQFGLRGVTDLVSSLADIAELD